ncbi:MAG TPA: NAD-dependent epimerase/dehydratase family protein [Bacteroidia bacterium]|nr:NAD-dependent epimerase/dehydratase family protein [Bacteroidia bacterium]
MQTILGSGGAIGLELAKALQAYSNPIRLVSRNPVKVNAGDQLFPADLSDHQAIDKAIEGSTVCYVSIGFEYKLEVWKKHWPSFIKRVTESCIKHGVRLVFFDNIYALDVAALSDITEQSPINPCSKKGFVRAELDRHILENVEKGKLQAIIARAPDFFGPYKKQNSMLMNLVYDNMVKGKKAQWLCSADMPHSMGYTKDLAIGTAILGNTPDAYNQIWNLPVDDQAPNGREWAGLFAEVMHQSGSIQVLPAWALWTLGRFIPIMKEIYEMRYQYDRPYVFNSSKFKTKFNYRVSTNKEAVLHTIEALKKH